MFGLNFFLCSINFEEFLEMSTLLVANAGLFTFTGTESIHQLKRDQMEALLVHRCEILLTHNLYFLLKRCLRYHEEMFYCRERRVSP